MPKKIAFISICILNYLGTTTFKKVNYFAKSGINLILNEYIRNLADLCLIHHMSR